MKLESEYIKEQYRSGIVSYTQLTKEVGLWESEKYVFQKFLRPTDKILDLGCGTGRTTFPLFNLGFKNIIGVDLTDEMIFQARQLNEHFKTKIEFIIGDATDLSFPKGCFDCVIFSFNGLMSIPMRENRFKAVREINQVLSDSGIFIFTTHDRDEEEQFLEFWKEESARWQRGNYNPLLYEFGDLITMSKNESREIYIHIPDQAEVKDLLSNAGFSIIESFYRSEKFNESTPVKAKSGECRFWVAKKNGNSSEKLLDS